MISVRPVFLAIFFILPWSVVAQTIPANVPPKITSAIPNATLFHGAAAEVVDLSKHFTDPDTTGARLTTILGSIDLALYSKATPITVTNFLKYVDSGAYKITDPTTGDPAPIFFHRSVAGFVIQSGGFLATVSPDNPPAIRPTPVTPFSPIKNEPGISNTRGTIAMAKIDGAPDSATDQWFINLANNSAGLDKQNGGFTVFGRVLGNGMAVADAIAALPVFNFGTPFDKLPLRDYTTADFNAKKPATSANLILLPRVARSASSLNFTATSSNPAIAAVTVSGSNLLVSPKNLGTVQINVIATDADGASVSEGFSVSIITAPPHLANISTRVVVGAKDDALIGGFIVLGNLPKRVAIRALGPSLSSAGLKKVLADPTLELHDGKGKILATNDNWEDAPNEQDIIDIGLAPTRPNESVILATLPSGSNGSAYTAVIHGAGGTGGVGLVEIYDLDSGPGSSVLNISTRGDVQSGDHVMIGGVIVGGDSPQRVLVRALGPSLASAGLADPLDDPTLTLINAQGTQIDFNDNWQSNPDAAEIQASTVAPKNPKESAVVQTLPAGGYTAIVRGAAGTTGTGLVEAYALQ